MLADFACQVTTTPEWRSGIEQQFRMGKDAFQGFYCVYQSPGRRFGTGKKSQTARAVYG